MAELKIGPVDPIKEAFTKVREDIDLLKKEINNNKKEISSQKELLESINKKLEEFLDFSKEINNKIAFFNVSSGNNGVGNNQQQSTTINNNRQQQAIKPSNVKHSSDDLKDIKLDQTLTFRFKSLSDREFSVFLAIYELEQEIGEVGFTELANKLKIFESTVRTVVYTLISKEIPIIKDRFFHKKVSLSIQKDFKNPKIMRELINLRENKGKQTTLLS